jgi:hypothetical protein
MIVEVMGSGRGKTRRAQRIVVIDGTKSKEPVRPDDPSPKVYEDGTKKWHQNGKLHREDGPAIEWAGGTRTWFRDDKCHRADGPAIIYPDGRKEWWLNGEPMEEKEVKEKASRNAPPPILEKVTF